MSPDYCKQVGNQHESAIMLTYLALVTICNRTITVADICVSCCWFVLFLYTGYGLGAWAEMKQDIITF